MDAIGAPRARRRESEKPGAAAELLHHRRRVRRVHDRVERVLDRQHEAGGERAALGAGVHQRGRVREEAQRGHLVVEALRPARALVDVRLDRRRSPRQRARTCPRASRRPRPPRRAAGSAARGPCARSRSAPPGCCWTWVPMTMGAPPPPGHHSSRRGTRRGADCNRTDVLLSSGTRRRPVSRGRITSVPSAAPRQRRAPAPGASPRSGDRLDPASAAAPDRRRPAGHTRAERGVVDARCH